MRREDQSQKLRLWRCGPAGECPARPLGGDLRTRPAQPGQVLQSGGELG